MIHGRGESTGEGIADPTPHCGHGANVSSVSLGAWVTSTRDRAKAKLACLPARIAPIRTDALDPIISDRAERTGTATPRAALNTRNGRHRSNEARHNAREGRLPATSRIPFRRLAPRA